MYVNMHRNYAAEPEILFISIVSENFFLMGSLYEVLIFFCLLRFSPGTPLSAHIPGAADTMGCFNVPVWVSVRWVISRQGYPVLKRLPAQSWFLLTPCIAFANSGLPGPLSAVIPDYRTTNSS